MKTKRIRIRQGFTIVELVIVIGVIGVLSAVLIPTFVNVQQKAEAAALKSNLANAYSSYIADAADGKIDDNSVVNGAEAEAKYFIAALTQEETILKDSVGAYEFDSVDGWKALTAAFDAANKDIVLTTVSPKVYAGKVVTYGGYEVYSKVAHA